MKSSLTTNKINLKRFRISSAGNEWDCHCHCLAHSEYTLRLAGLVGRQTTLKAIRAILIQQTKARFGGCGNGCGLDESGYQTYMTKLGYDWYHMVIVSKDKRVLTCTEGNGLYDTLMSDVYTTPILPGWLETIRTLLTEQYYLFPMEGFGHSASILMATPGALDTLVSQGVRDGKLVIA